MRLVRHQGRGYAGTDEEGPHKIRDENGEIVPEKGVRSPGDLERPGGDIEGATTIGSELGDDSSTWGGERVQQPDQDEDDDVP